MLLGQFQYEKERKNEYKNNKEYYQIPESDADTTRYYYNYVDLNGDGTDEILALVVGPYTSGSGGDSAVWCMKNDDKIQIMQAFTLVNAPMVITDAATNGEKYGAKGLILQRMGGGAKPEMIELTSVDGEYTSVSDAKPVQNIDDLQGTAIWCNDLADDVQTGQYLTLKDYSTYQSFEEILRELKPDMAYSEMKVGREDKLGTEFAGASPIGFTVVH